MFKPEKFIFPISLCYAYPIMIIPIVYPYYFIMFSKLFFHLERLFHYNNHDRIDSRNLYPILTGSKTPADGSLLYNSPDKGDNKSH
jgi:hypothetical protein